MKDCNEHNDQEGLMLDFLLGRLNPELTEKLEDELEANPSLQEELAFEANLLAALTEYVEESTPPAQKVAKKSGIKRMLLTVSTIAAMFFFAVVGINESFAPDKSNAPSIVKNNNISSGIQSYLIITDFGYDQVIQSFSPNFIKPSWFELKNGVSS